MMAVLCLCGVAFHSARKDPAPTLVNTHEVEAIVVDADFNGDGCTDKATGSTSASGYEIEIDFACQPQKTLLPVPGNRLGIRIFAYDIDGDNDQDIVIADSISLFPIAVWINDGKGHFEPGNPWLCYHFFLDNPNHYSRHGDQRNPNAPLLKPRHSFSGLIRACFEIRLESAPLRFHSSPDAALQTKTLRLRSRSPPLVAAV